MCLGCQLANKLILVKEISNSANFIAILDIDPINPGHIIILPKFHYERIIQLPDDLLIELRNLLHTLQKLVHERLNYTDFSIQSNEGLINDLNAHLHIHLIPRKKEDKLDYSNSQLNPLDLEFIYSKLT